MIFVCGDGKTSLEDAWLESIALAQMHQDEIDRPERERQWDLGVAADLYRTHEFMFVARDGVDPFWPDATSDPFEETEVEQIPVELLW
jgi:hypothetical protein